MSISCARWWWLLGPVLAVACTRTAATDLAVSNHLQERRVSSVVWDTLQNVSRTVYDTTLVNPIHLRVNSAGIWLNDAGAPRIALLDHAGTLRWTFGREGGGPGEFRGVRDLEVAGDRAVAILDPGNARITVLQEDRSFREVAIDGVGHAEELVPLAAGDFMLVTLRADSSLVHVGADGTPHGRVPVPWPRFAKLHPLASQNHTAASLSGRRWALGLTLGPVFFVFDGPRSMLGPASYVEWIEAPEVVRADDGSTRLPQVPYSGLSIELDRDTVYVRFGGRGPHRGRLVDRYAAGSGSYAGSLVLPVAPREMAVRDGVFYLLERTDGFGLLIVRPVQTE